MWDRNSDNNNNNNNGDDDDSVAFSIEIIYTQNHKRWVICGDEVTTLRNLFRT